MAYITDFSKYSGLMRQPMLVGLVLLTLIGSALAQTPINPEKSPRTLVVTDSVQLSGSKISGGWREHAVDGSWRRVAFVLDGRAGTVTFGDGKKGSRIPSVSRYVYVGHGGKDAKAGDEPSVFSEARVFAGATPEIRDKANQSSLVPDKVATRVRELGGDIKLMQQAADIKRISELGSALDAARSVADDGRFFGDRPGGSPRRDGDGWTDPRRGVGRDGRASDDVVIYDKGGTDEAGNYVFTIITRHDGGSTTTDIGLRAPDGSGVFTTEDKDASGRVTGGYQSTSSGDSSTRVSYTRNPETGVEVSTATITSPDGSTQRSTTIFYPGGKRRTYTPSEVPFSGRGGFDEAWMDKSLPWFMDSVYVQWKRESDLVQSGGRIAQPGRGDNPSPGTSEGPRVGTNAVVNCGDSTMNPCARFGGTTVDTQGRLGGLSQPPRGEPSAGPGGMGVPAPLPPPPKQ